MMHRLTSAARHLEVKPSALLPFLCLLLCFSLRLGFARSFGLTTLIMLSLLVHELGHATVAAAYGVPVKRIGFAAIGAYTVREYSGRAAVEALSAASGPLMNLVIFVVVRLGSGELAHILATVNLVIAVSNLFPFPGTDGWRLLKAVLLKPALVPTASVSKHAS